MHLYPEATGPVSEFFHSSQMLAMDDISLDLGQLMWAEWEKAPHRHFYIKEIARLSDGRFVIPLKWITVSGIESFDGLPLTYDRTVSHTKLERHNMAAHILEQSDVFCIEPDRSIRAPAADLRDNFLDLRAQGYKNKFVGAYIK